MTPDEKRKYIDHVLKTLIEHEIEAIFVATPNDRDIAVIHCCKEQQKFIFLLAALMVDFPVESVMAMKTAVVMKETDNERERKHRADSGGDGDPD